MPYVTPDMDSDEIEAEMRAREIAAQRAAHARSNAPAAAAAKAAKTRETLLVIAKMAGARMPMEQIAEMARVSVKHVKKRVEEIRAGTVTEEIQKVYARSKKRHQAAADRLIEK